MAMKAVPLFWKVASKRFSGSVQFFFFPLNRNFWVSFRITVWVKFGLLGWLVHETRSWCWGWIFSSTCNWINQQLVVPANIGINTASTVDSQHALYEYVKPQWTSCLWEDYLLSKNMKREILLKPLWTSVASVDGKEVYTNEFRSFNYVAECRDSRTQLTNISQCLNTPEKCDPAAAVL